LCGTPRLPREQQVPFLMSASFAILPKKKKIRKIRARKQDSDSNKQLKCSPSSSKERKKKK